MSLHDKPVADPGPGADAVRYLDPDGLVAWRVELDAANRHVMAAYGQSRLREFVLGGATGYSLAEPFTPGLMSR